MDTHFKQLFSENQSGSIYIFIFTNRLWFAISHLYKDLFTAGGHLVFNGAKDLSTDGQRSLKLSTRS